MPFKSEAQRRYLYANHPEIAERWAKNYVDGGCVSAPTSSYADGGVVYANQGNRVKAQQQRVNNMDESMQVDWSDAGKFVLEMTPIIGDAIAAKEVWDELQKDPINWTMVGILGGAAIIGLIPGIGDAIASVIRKAAKLIKSVPEVAKHQVMEIVGGIKGLPIDSQAQVIDDLSKLDWSKWSGTRQDRRIAQNELRKLQQKINKEFGTDIRIEVNSSEHGRYSLATTHDGARAATVSIPGTVRGTKELLAIREELFHVLDDETWKAVSPKLQTFDRFRNEALAKLRALGTKVDLPEDTIDWYRDTFKSYLDILDDRLDAYANYRLTKAEALELVDTIPDPDNPIWRKLNMTPYDKGMYRNKIAAESETVGKTGILTEEETHSLIAKGGARAVKPKTIYIQHPDGTVEEVAEATRDMFDISAPQWSRNTGFIETPHGKAKWNTTGEFDSAHRNQLIARSNVKPLDPAEVTIESVKGARTQVKWKQLPVSKVDVEYKVDGILSKKLDEFLADKPMNDGVMQGDGGKDTWSRHFGKNTYAPHKTDKYNLNPGIDTTANWRATLEISDMAWPEITKYINSLDLEPADYNELLKWARKRSLNIFAKETQRKGNKGYDVGQSLDERFAGSEYATGLRHLDESDIRWIKIQEQPEEIQQQMLEMMRNGATWDDINAKFNIMAPKNMCDGGIV